MTVLIFTRAAVTVERVVAALARRGHPAVVVCTDTVSARTSLSLHADGTLTVADAGAAPRHITDLHAVWYRRMAASAHLPPDTPPDVRRVVRQELGAFLHGILAAMTVPVFQPKAHIDHADLRPAQLAHARAVGLDVPATVTTTDLSVARAFVAAQGGHAVTKMVTGAVLPDRAGGAKVMMTTPLDTATLAAMDAAELRLCPATIQEHLDKAAEYRVTIVGRRLFVARLPRQASDATTATDWRRDGAAVARQWAPAQLPPAVEAALLRLMDRLQLDYGAADVVETTCGRFVFLEVNPAGEYLWLEPLFGDAVSEALADLLTGAEHSRLHGRWT